MGVQVVKILGNTLALTNVAGGDLSGSYPGPSVASVGASSAANIHTAEVLANSSTDLNTVNQIVKRDSNGKIAVGEVDVSQGILSNYRPKKITVSASTYTLLSSDMGALVYFTFIGPVSIIVQSGLPTDFHCTLISLSTGDKTLVASGTVLVSRQGYTKIGGENAALVLLPTLTANKYIVQGDGI